MHGVEERDRVLHRRFAVRLECSHALRLVRVELDIPLVGDHVLLGDRRVVERSAHVYEAPRPVMYGAAGLVGAYDRLPMEARQHQRAGRAVELLQCCRWYHHSVAQDRRAFADCHRPRRSRRRARRSLLPSPAVLYLKISTPGRTVSIWGHV